MNNVKTTMASPQRKRAKIYDAEQPPKWKVTILSPSALITIVRAVKSVATYITLELTDKQFVSVQVMDSGQVSMYKARVKAEIETQTDETQLSATVNSQQLETAIEGACGGSYILTFFPNADESKIIFHTRETENTSYMSGYVSKMELGTRASDVAHKELQLWDCDYNAFVATSALRNVLKKVVRIGANRVSVSVLTINNTPEDEEGILLRLSATCKTTGSMCEDYFFSKVDTATDTPQALASVFENKRLADISDDMVTIQYNEMFDVKYLQMFIKATDRDTVFAKLSSGKPLICEIDLGNESNVSLVLAPLAEENTA